MKRRLSVLVVIAVLTAVVFTGCSDSGSDSNKVYNIGVCQLVEHPALDAATQGFKDALTAKLGEANVKFDVQNAQGEQATSATICNGFVADNVDLILANATTPLQTAAAATSSIPILGTSVTDYASALQIDNWNGTTGRNISGTSDLAPIDQQEKMIKDIFPDVQKVGLLYCTAESNSAYQIDSIIKSLEADGIAYVKYGIADSNEIQSVVTNAVSECDVLYIPTDNTLADATETIYNIVVPAKVPVIAGEEGICKGCGVATLSISYYDLGYTTGEMAYEILVNGKDIKSLEIKYAPNTTKKYNKSICDKLGIAIPSDYTAIDE